MTLAVIAVLLGLGLLVWSAGMFVEGAAALARHFGMPALLIGMVIVGFGTSAPEMVVSAIASFQGNPGIALGNAYGSNITNIALIIGVTALISPIAVHSSVLKKELPVLAAVTVLAGVQLVDGTVSRLDAVVLFAVFGGLMTWTVVQGLKGAPDAFADEIEAEMTGRSTSPAGAAMRLGAGLVVLVASSRMLVWGAVSIAGRAGVSDMVIGLTVVAVGTSLPELASSIIAARRGEHDIALGNVIGSNLFNTLAVVGIAGAINPIEAGPEVLHRDVTTMAALTFALFVFGWGIAGPGRINRLEGGACIVCYVGYTAYLVFGAFG